MKDYESYRNNGNKDIPDNPKLKKNEFYNRQFQDNILPGEYYDCRVNGLECELDDKDNFAYDSGEKGAKQTELDDLQEITNAVGNTSASASSASTASSSSIVESAGTVITGTATVVVGASAAVVAFNAIPKDPPKMTINKLEAGSTYVYYDLNFENLDTDKEYDIVIKNPYHSFKIECSNGEQDGYVYDLKPGLSYTLSFIGPHALFGSAEYGSETFYTLPSEEIFATPTINITYNSDLTCDVTFKSTVFDDYNKLDATYVSLTQNSKVLFDSFNLKNYENNPNIVYEYDSNTKTHSGTIKNVDTGVISFSTYIIDSETNQKSVLETITKEAINPLSYTTGTNYITVSGDNELIKDIMEVENDLYVRVNLFNSDNELTKIEGKVDLSDDKFNFRTLVRQDTKSFNYEIGYYDNDEFITVNKIANKVFTGGTYNATYKAVTPEDENNINVKWIYDDEGNETADITLLTNFDNNGNDDVYYRVELLRMDYSGEQGPGDQYLLVDTYEGTGNPTFKNVQLGDYEEDGYYYRFLFRYTSLMNYYLDGVENDVVEVEVRKGVASEDGLLPLDPIIYYPDDQDISLLSNGKLSLYFFKEESSEEGQDSKIRVDDDNVKLTFNFYEGDYNVITNVSSATNIETVSEGPERSLLTFNLDCPEYGTVGYYVDYEIPYHERYGGNIRLLRRTDINAGDIDYMHREMHYQAAPVEIYQVMNGSQIDFKIKFVTFMPDTWTIKAVDGNNNYYSQVLGDDGYYYIADTFNDGAYLTFNAYNEDGEMISNYILDNYSVDSTKASYMELFTLNDFLTEDFGAGKIVYTYNDDGTININLLTKFDNPNPDFYNIYVDYWLLKQDYELGGYVTVGEALQCKDTVVNFNSTQDNPFDYLDTFKIKYRVHVESVDVAYGDYSLYYESTTYECLDFTGSNLSSLSHDNELKPQRYDMELYLMQLVATSEFIYPKDQTVTFSADGAQSMSFVLSELEPEITGDGTYYMFEISSELYEQPMIDFTIKANYTLTEEKLEALGDNYEGNLYNEFTYQILGA